MSRAIRLSFDHRTTMNNENHWSVAISKITTGAKQGTAFYLSPATPLVKLSTRPPWVAIRPILRFIEPMRPLTL